MRTTNAEAIGAGRLWHGVSDPEIPSDIPAPFPRGTAMGQHLRVRRLARVLEGKLLYVVDNLGPKWSRRMCWACGNKYSPNRAQACSYCSTPLSDLEFLMTSRWDASRFQGFEDFARERLKHLGLISPLAVLYRANQMMAVYHYNGESLLVDEPAPLPADVVLSIARRLGDTLSWLHAKGVLLGAFGPKNVVVMPDGSVRWFDLDVEKMLAGGMKGLERHPDRPVQRDTRNLAALLQRYTSPDDAAVADVLAQAASGAVATPGALAEAATRLLATPSRPVEHRSSAFTDVGLARSLNEDVWGWRRLDDNASLYVVADGMGGHARGEIASAMAVEAVCRAVTEGARGNRLDDATLEKLLRAGMAAANASVLDYGKRFRLTLGAAVVATVLVGDRLLLVAHAGDCRAYLLRAGVLRRLTSDHTVAAELVADGQISPDDAAKHPRANVLTVVVGGEPELDFELEKVPVQPGDRLLLCSDGLWNDLSDEELASYLHGYGDRRTAIQMLTRTVYERSGKDNITMQIVDVR